METRNIINRMTTEMNLQSLNFGLDETLLALQDSISAFCAKEIAPIAQQVDQDNIFPAHLWKKFGDMGFFEFMAVNGLTD